MTYKADFKQMPARLVRLKYGDKRDFPKIDIYADGRYICSTTWSATCRQAAAIMRDTLDLKNAHGLTGREIITASFAK